MSKSSPFENVHELLGANFGEYDGWRLPSDYGDIAAESKGLYEGSVAFDLSSFGKISIKGDKSCILINKLLGGRGEEVTEGKWIWSAVFDKNGQTIETARIGRCGDNYMIFTRPEKRQGVLTAARECADECGLEDVEIADVTEETGMLAVYGPEAVKAVGNILPFDVAGIDEESFKNVSVFVVSFTIIRGSWVGSDGIEMLCPRSACGMAAEAVTRYHKKENIIPGGMDCLKQVMAGAGVPIQAYD